MDTLHKTDGHFKSQLILQGAMAFGEWHIHARSVRFLVQGRRATEWEARTHAAEGEVVYAVPALVGGGCGMSVSYACVCTMA